MGDDPVLFVGCYFQSVETAEEPAERDRRPFRLAHFEMRPNGPRPHCAEHEWLLTEDPRMIECMRCGLLEYHDLSTAET